VPEEEDEAEDDDKFVSSSTTYPRKNSGVFAKGKVAVAVVKEEGCGGQRPSSRSLSLSQPLSRSRSLSLGRILVLRSNNREGVIVSFGVDDTKAEEEEKDPPSGSIASSRSPSPPVSILVRTLLANSPRGGEIEEG
jgi:hypothetical protein